MANGTNIIYAPNIRGGGGLVLLRGLLHAANAATGGRAFLDERSAPLLPSFERISTSWVKPGLAGRLRAERDLAVATSDGDITLCFSGVPPLLRQRGKVIVYAQNSLTISNYSLDGFPLRTAARLQVERVLHRLLSGNVDEYVVQTSNMQRMVQTALIGMQVQVVPFIVPSNPAQTVERTSDSPLFIYPAHDDPHKNHKNLIEAWTLLAIEGLFPILALTLEDGNNRLIDPIAGCRGRGGKIRCLGALSHMQMIEEYRSATALVYPSLTESLGLPLVEAQQVGLPIVASELDFVRDICDPVESFNPYSPISIARSIKRLLRITTRRAAPCTPDEAWAKIMRS
ncbi:glycosyltransferase [Rhodopseudomonas sp. G2_2311]|uniref:glycosyltransferase n=1 Tax=Rhodopseudomonas sp. G2_2311 TaxID=3114287 RepID=UPI0039C610E1